MQEHPGQRGIDFDISDNIFNGGGSGWNLGVINEAWAGGGKVHHNTFNKFAIGNQVELDNPALKISCNTYGGGSNDNSFDWFINPENPGYSFGPQGTGCDVDDDVRAGNEFNDNSNPRVASWAQPFLYYHTDALNSPPNAHPDANNISPWLCTNIPNDPSCVSSGEGDIEGMLTVWGTLKNTMITLKSEYDTVFTYLDSNYSDTLLAHIADTGYSNSTLTSDMLAHSFLSDEVITEACDRLPFFTDAQFKNIIISNSPVSWTVWQKVQERFEASAVYPTLSQAYIDTITSAQLTDTLRTLTTINREMAVIYSDADRIINDIVYLYADTNDIVGMITFLNDSCADQRHKKQAISIALAGDTISWSRTLLDSLSLEDANDTAFYEFYNIAIALAEDTLTWFGIDSTQKAMIIELSEQDYETKLNAQAVLALVYDSVYERIPETIPEISGKWDGETPPVQQQTPEEQTSFLNNIKVYPNPFTNSFNINYSFEEKVNELRFEVYDVTGRLAKQEIIKNTQTNTISIDTSPCMGMFFLRIIADGNQVHFHKLACIDR